MNRKTIIKKLKSLQKAPDTAEAHGKADDLLCDLLNYLGYEDVTEEYYKVEKWYS